MKDLSKNNIKGKQKYEKKEIKSEECNQKSFEINLNTGNENDYQDSENTMGDYENCQPEILNGYDHNTGHFTAENKRTEVFKRPLLPFCHYMQSNNYIYINVKCEINKISFFYIEVIDSKTFNFQYKYLGNGFVPLTYGCSVCTAPYTFKTKGVTHEILNDTLLVKVEKKKPVLWHKIKIGIEQRKMKEIKLKGLHIINDNDILLYKPSPVEQEPQNQLENHESKSAFENGTEGLDEDQNLNKLSSQSNGKETNVESTELMIPHIVRRTSDYFLTGSWPRGILKVRSRSLSDSQMDLKSHSTPTTNGYDHMFSTSLECEDEDVEEEEEKEEGKFDQETGEEEEDGGESSSTKKSVRFNDFVWKQVFRANASILGQRAKNQKKARQKQRSRERKLSEEGSQSSETETYTDPSDVATTEEDSSAELEMVKRKEFSGLHSHSFRGKTQTKKPKKKGQKYSYNKNRSNKKPSLNLSNEMVFQLDEI